MMGISEFWQMVIKGIVIIVAVIIDQMQNRMQHKAAIVSQKVTAIPSDVTSQAGIISQTVKSE